LVFLTLRAFELKQKPRGHRPAKGIIMAEQFALKGDERASFGKGAARKLRAKGLVPAVIYGHGENPRHVTVDAHELSLLVRHKNVLIDLDVNGKKELVLVKDVQKDYVRQIIEHVDLVIVKKGETVTVDIPVSVIGQPFAGTVAMLEHQTIQVEAEATHIPEHLEVDVTGMLEHTHISAKDVVLPAGVKLHLDPEAIIVAIQAVAGAESQGSDSASEGAAE
jgi:large subunit ribosomal protein L25